MIRMFSIIQRSHCSVEQKTAGHKIFVKEYNKQAAGQDFLSKNNKREAASKNVRPVMIHNYK